MVRFPDFGGHVQKGYGGVVEIRCNAILEGVWRTALGNDCKYIRSILPNGDFRYAPAKPNRNESKLVAILASAFREYTALAPADEGHKGLAMGKKEKWLRMRGQRLPAMRTRMKMRLEENGGKVDANQSADGDENYENKTEEEVEIGSSGRYCLEKESRLSRTVELSECEASDEDQDSSNPLRHLEASRVCRRPVDNEMPYDFNRPVQGVTLEQQQAIDDFVMQLEEIKETVPAMYHRLCLQVLCDSRPI